ncbi:MAG: glycoside hydrolase family 5 protein [Prevotella sp.]|nr:glycoside hydrolase family 5 protein [Prevotella sp.]
MGKLKTLMTGMLLMVAFHTEAVDFETATDAVKNMGVGWNMGNTLEANNQSVTSDITSDAYWGQQGLESETCWGQYPTKPELLKMMKEAGFGAIRVPVTWYNHMDKDGKVDAAWMARVHEVVDYVMNQGMYCIINVHHDTGADGNSFKSWIKADEANYAQNKDRYEYLWRQIAEEFKDYDEHLLFESYNEMLDKYSSWCFASFSSPAKYNASDAASAYNAINSYAQSFVTTVRATGGNNAQRNLIVNTYGSCSGGGTWNQHLKDPLKEMKYPTDAAGEGHVIFQVHAYPSLVDGDKNRTIASIKGEIDEMISAWNTHLVSKGGPVILGEWGTSNVDADVTDYDARRDLMFQFCEYLVQQCKANNIGSFYWMGLSNGMARFFPAFSQPDLAKTILQAYHGSSFNPVLPDAKDFSISCTVDFNQQWGEFNLYKGSSFTSADYSSVVLELEDAPVSGLLQWKVSCSKYSNGFTRDITSAESTLAFAANMGTITGITLQCKQSSGHVRIKSVKLKNRNGEEESCSPSVAWGCTMSDVAASSSTGIYEVQQDAPSDDRIYDLSGRRLSQKPEKGVYIQNGKKYIK